VGCREGGGSAGRGSPSGIVTIGSVGAGVLRRTGGGGGTLTGRDSTGALI
jgi:hypothetical protein